MSASARRRTFEGLLDVVFHGEFPCLRGLYEVHARIDLDGGFDLSKKGDSGRWLLPNRHYESGFFGVPMLTEPDSEAADYLKRLGIGWAVPPEEAAIVDLITHRLPAECAAVAVMDAGFTDDNDLQALVRFWRAQGLPTQAGAA